MDGPWLLDHMASAHRGVPVRDLEDAGEDELSDRTWQQLYFLAYVGTSVSGHSGEEDGKLPTYVYNICP